MANLIRKYIDFLFFKNGYLFPLFYVYECFTDCV